jgi:hypothetical protein
MRELAEHVIAREDRLLFGLTPFDDESFFGFTARLAAWNHFDSRRQFLLNVAFPHLLGEGLQAALEDRGHLAWRLRLSDEQLGRLTGRHDPELDRYRELISLVARRVAPAALRKAPYHRASWALQLPYCPESWEMLVDHCPGCQGRLGWAKVLAIETCEHCGFDLRTAETTTVPKRLRKPLALMAGLIDRDPLKRLSPQLNIPPHIASCSPFEIFELAMVFARATALTKGRAKLTMTTPIKKGATIWTSNQRWPEPRYSLETSSKPLRGLNAWSPRMTTAIPLRLSTKASRQRRKATSRACENTHWDGSLLATGLERRSVQARSCNTSSTRSKSRTVAST